MKRRMSRREGNSPSRSPKAIASPVTSFPGDARANTLANIGPPLLAIRSRFPDRTELRGRLWDPMQANPNTVMPPFGKHRILSSDEIELIIDYLYTQ